MKKGLIEFIPHPSVPDFQLKSDLCRNWLITTATSEEKRIARLSYLFCDDDHMLAVNRKYLHHDFLTDILTFPYRHPGGLEADILISVDRVLANAKDLRVPAGMEMCRVLVHGLLHLCGYNDQTDSEKLEMRTLENHYLSRLPESGYRDIFSS